MRHLIAGALLLPLVGCASLETDGLWALPPMAPGSLEEPTWHAATVAAVGSAAVAPTALQLWRPGAGPLELGQVLASVENSHPLLSAARQEQTIAEARQLAALGSFDLRLAAGADWAAEGFYEHNTARVSLEQPTGLWGLRATGGYRVGAGDFDPTFDGKRATNHGGELSLGVRLPLLRGGSIDAARRDLLTSGLDREIAASDLAALRLRYAREAAVAYWRWIGAGRRLEVAEELLQLATERQEGLELRVRRGDLPEIEAIDNRRLVVRRRALRVAARRSVERAAIALSLFLRDERGEPLRPSREALPLRFPEPARPDARALAADLVTALQVRPDLRRLAQQRGRTGVDLRYARNQLLPQLDLSVMASQDLDGRRPSPTKGELEVTAGLEVGFALQNRRARAGVATNLAKLEQLEERERYLRDQVLAEVRDAHSELLTSYERVQEASEAARLAREVATAERRRFQLGDSTVLQLNLREAATAEADVQSVAALLDYWSAVATYRAAVGVAP